MQKNTVPSSENVTNKSRSTEGLPQSNRPGGARRRSFLQGFGLFMAALSAGGLFPANWRAQPSPAARQKPNKGDVAILKLLAAAELVEADLWQQYAELGGLTPGQLPVETAPFTPMNSYQAAFMNLDSDGPQYISSNSLDEQSHAEFLNAYLISIGEEPVDFDEFRTLPSSQAAGAQQIGLLTNLTQLPVDTSWFTRYRSTTSPDFGASFPQALPALF